MASGTPASESTHDHPTQAGRFQTAKFFAINAFLIFHILAITCWCSPITTPLTVAARNLVRPYLIWSGLFQSWDMFSPDPKSKNIYLEAVVIYKDGSTELWPFPRMEMLSLTQRYFRERYRKFEENLGNDAYSDLRPDAARHIARLENNRPSPPQKVMLVVRWTDIIPPRAGNSYDRGPWGVEIFYTYDVQPGDLQ
jgi:hypothetical protein